MRAARMVREVKIDRSLCAMRSGRSVDGTGVKRQNQGNSLKNP
jgi:hypothetical protein